MRRSLVLVAGGVLLAGCELPSFGAPDPASREGSDVLSIWKGFFVAGLAVAALVLGLIFYAAVRFRRRDDVCIQHQVTAACLQSGRKARETVVDHSRRIYRLRHQL